MRNSPFFWRIHAIRLSVYNIDKRKIPPFFCTPKQHKWFLCVNNINTNCIKNYQFLVLLLDTQRRMAYKINLIYLSRCFINNFLHSVLTRQED